MMWVLFVGAMVLGWLSMLLIRRLCFRFGIFDAPNVRSAHRQPTPTLGGVGLVLSTCGLVGLAALINVPMPPFWVGLLIASGILCILIRDELTAMGRLAKLLIQIGAAIAVMADGVVLTHLSVLDATVDFGFLSLPITLIFLVALQNLYNFMDGLDGFAGLEGVLVASLMAMLAWHVSMPLAVLSVVLSGAALGFWIWNMPPARIFMGDVGAHFLALCFGVLAIEGNAAGVPLYVMILPLGVFLYDAVYTLFRRLLRGENITLAHQFHLYQRLNRMGWSPWRINVMYAICTLLLGTAAFGLQNGWLIVARAAGGLAALMLVGGALSVERWWAQFERTM